MPNPSTTERDRLLRYCRNLQSGPERGNDFHYLLIEAAYSCGYDNSGLADHGTIQDLRSRLYDAESALKLYRNAERTHATRTAYNPGAD
jgi:hypothetical protein